MCLTSYYIIYIYLKYTYVIINYFCIQINGGIYKDYNENCDARKRDLCSHFILRLIYCKSDELRKWFINREIELFKLRWSLLSKGDKLKFLSSNNTNYSAVSNANVKKYFYEVKNIYFIMK